MSTDTLDEALKSIRTLQKDNARLREALADAQELNAGLERDKDNAHMLFQIVLDMLPGRFVEIGQNHLRAYDPRQWYVERTSLFPSQAIRYTLKDK